MSKEIDKKKETAIVDPSQTLGRGHEEQIDPKDMEIPRGKLIQSTSEEATAENKNERIEVGLIINSISKETLPVEFIPIFKFSNWIRWNPRKKDDPNFDAAFDPGALIWTCNDPNDPRVIENKDFGPAGEAPVATKYLNFFSYFPGHGMPIIVSFKKTSFRAGQRLLTLSRFSGGDMFSRKYRLTSKIKEANGTKFFVLDVTMAGKPSEQEFKIAESWYNNFKDKAIKVHEEEAPIEE